jgi:hypothetical protein
MWQFGTNAMKESSARGADSGLSPRPKMLFANFRKQNFNTFKD